MKFQIFNGSIEFSAGTITRQVSRQEFLQSPIGKSAREAVVNPPWITYNFSPESGVACNAIFEGDRLDRLTLQLRVPADDADKWTPEAEKERLKLHDKWLRSELGKPPYRYAWGSIDSSLDPRDGYSDIVLAYAESRAVKT